MVTTPCEATVTVTGATPVRADVVIDPGHGAPDPGAVGPNGLWESTVNLAVSEAAKAALEREGFGVVLTRSFEHDATLEGRARLARLGGARAFISVHHNAAADTSLPGPGADVYHQEQSPESRRLAGLIYEELTALLSTYEADWVGVTPTGVKYRRGRRGTDYYGVLRRSAPVPGALTEAMYIDNPSEAALLAQPEVQKAEGEAIARGVLRFLRTADPGSGFVPGIEAPLFTGPFTGRPPGTVTCVEPPLI